MYISDMNVKLLAMFTFLRVSVIWHCLLPETNVIQDSNPWHLDYNERHKLKLLLTIYKNIVNVSLGKMARGEYHINLKDDTPRSLQKRCFPVSKCYERKFKAELDRLEKLNVIQKLYGDET